jgi:hypothetical protein
VTGFVFLLIAFALSIGGSLVLWLRHRDPTTLDHAIDEFQREMRALAPDAERSPRSEPSGRARREP